MNKRIKLVQTNLINNKIDALLVTNYHNIFYLTDFQTLAERDAFAVITKNHVYLLTDERYLSKNSDVKFPISNQARNPNLQIKIIDPDNNLIKHLLSILKDEGTKKIGFEGEDLKYSEYLSLKERLQVDLTSTSQLIPRLREIKEDDEIAKIKRACRIGDQCLKEIIPLIKLGKTEKEIAFKIEFWLKEKNHDIAFEPIVAVDQNASIPHYQTKSGGGKIKSGSVILIDFGVKYQNYCSDMTRTLFFDLPKTEILYIYNILRETQEKTICQLNEESSLKEIDCYCRKLMIDNRLPTYPHSTGHGLGLEVHEYPKISTVTQDTKKPDQVFTIEPGVYFPGNWGARIEDTVVIDNKGKAETLTKFEKKAIIL